MRGPLLSALTQVGGEPKSGRAPRSGLERALQEFLDGLDQDEEMRE